MLNRTGCMFLTDPEQSVTGNCGLTQCCKSRHGLGNKVCVCGGGGRKKIPSIYGKRFKKTWFPLTSAVLPTSDRVRSKQDSMCVCV